MPTENRQGMFPIPFFIWTKKDTNLDSRSNDKDAEQKSTTLLASSVSNFSGRDIMEKATLIHRDTVVGRSLIQSIRKPKRYVQLSSTISGMLSELHWRDELLTSSSIKEIHWLCDHEAKGNLWVLSGGAIHHCVTIIISFNVTNILWKAK